MFKINTTWLWIIIIVHETCFCISVVSVGGGCNGATAP